MAFGSKFGFGRSRSNEPNNSGFGSPSAPNGGFPPPPKPSGPNNSGFGRPNSFPPPPSGRFGSPGGPNNGGFGSPSAPNGVNPSKGFPPPPKPSAPNNSGFGSFSAPNNSGFSGPSNGATPPNPPSFGNSGFGAPLSPQSNPNNSPSGPSNGFGPPSGMPIPPMPPDPRNQRMPDSPSDEPEYRTGIEKRLWDGMYKEADRSQREFIEHTANFSRKIDQIKENHERQMAAIEQQRLNPPPTCNELHDQWVNKYFPEDQQGGIADSFVADHNEAQRNKPGFSGQMKNDGPQMGF